MPTTGEKIKELRTSHGLTQHQLADKVGVSSQVISNLERSYTSTRTRPELLSAIAQELGTTVEYLIGSKTYDEAPVTADEKELLQNYRKIKPYQQVLILTLLKDMAQYRQEGK